MGLRQSKEKLLYEQVVNHANVDAIKALHQQGAHLEWRDREGKTPLIVASMEPQLYDVANTLIQLGADVNAFRRGHNGGTPLHHAAKSGLDQTVKLLLSSGANALVKNDDHQTPLGVARIEGHTTVVRMIESHICFFSGWLRELHGPGFLELLAPQWLSAKKIWAVVIPCRPHNRKKHLKMKLCIYSSWKDSQPRTTVALWKAKVKEPKCHLTDPVLTIFDKHARTRYKFASANEGDKQQFQWFSNACRGIRQPKQKPLSPHTPVVLVAASPTSEDVELAMAKYASILSAIEEKSPVVSNRAGWGSSSANFVQDAGTPMDYVEQNSVGDVASNHKIDETAWIPSAPPVPDPIHYPLTTSTMEKKETRTSDVGSSSCVICLDAGVEGACIPCGHMAGCMSCLNGIKAKKWGCPVCRAHIDQVIRLYEV